MVPVLASAVVDVILPSTPQSLGSFRVEVWGREPYDFTRIYEIIATNNTAAAQEGIKRFVSEMEQMASQKE